MSGIIFFGKEAVTMKNKLLFTLCIAGSLLLGGCAARSESKAQTETVTLAPAYENYKKAAGNGQVTCCFFNFLPFTFYILLDYVACHVVSGCDFFQFRDLLFADWLLFGTAGVRSTFGSGSGIAESSASV